MRLLKSVNSCFVRRLASGQATRESSWSFSLQREPSQLSFYGGQTTRVTHIAACRSRASFICSYSEPQRVLTLRGRL